MIWPAIAIVPWGQSLILLGLLLALADPSARRPPAGVVLLLSGFALAIGLSTAFAFDVDAAIEEWQLWVSWILVVLLLASVVSSRERLLLFLFVYYLVNLKMAQHGFRTWAERGFGSANWGVSGSPGWFQNSGEFGMQMAMLVPLLGAHLALLSRQFNAQVLLPAMLFLVMVIGSAIASNSRGALLGLVAYGLWFATKSRMRIKSLLVVFIAASAIVAVIPEETMQRFTTAGDDQTSESRLTYWRHGIEAVREHPVFGVGFRNWGPYQMRRHPELMGITGRFEVMHNTPLEVASELGLVGLAVFLATLVYIFWTNSLTARRSVRNGDCWLAATATGLNGSLFVYLVTSFFMSVFMYPFLWVLLALSASCGSASKHSPSLPSNQGRYPLGAKRPVARRRSSR
jgi:O-antigen ligase